MKSLLSLLALTLLASCASSPKGELQSWKNSIGMTLMRVPVADPAQPQRSVWMASTETSERHMNMMRSEIGRRPRAGALPSSAACEVSWLDAQRFCRWLTERERASGDISPRQRYRLPTDHEWSCAVGIGHLEKEQARPEAKSNRVGGFPWGQTWPPPTGAGNYAGEEAKIHRSGAYILGFSDTQAKGAGRAGTSVTNALGLQDMGGNLWEWCEDYYRAGTNWRVLRGGAWTSYRPQTLAASHRTHDPETYKSDSVGFRCVLVSE